MSHTCHVGQVVLGGRQGGPVCVPFSARLLTVALEGTWCLKEKADPVRMARWEQH